MLLYNSTSSINYEKFVTLYMNYKNHIYIGKWNGRVINN